MRILLWLTIGFALACCVGVYSASGIWLWSTVAVFAVACVLLLMLKNKHAKKAAVVLLGLLLGILWLFGYDALHLTPIREQDGKTVQTSVEITDYSYETSYGIAADGKIALDGRIYRVRAYMDDMEQLSPGDQVEGRFRLRLTVRGALEESTYHQGNGIFLLIYGEDEVRVSRAETIPSKYFAAKLRADIQSILDRVFPEDVSAFARALLLGDSTKLSYQQDTAFQVSGIRHIIAVSGLHVSILFALIYMLCGKHRFLTAILGIPILIVFAAVAGFTPSIVRACIMQLLMILSIAVHKEYDPPTALAFSVLTMLAVNPMTILSVSFQLSVGCMIGIFLISKPLQDFFLARLGNPNGKTRKGRMLIWLCASVSVTLSAMALTTPLCAYYFGMVSIVGVIGNLLTLWVVSFIFYGIMLACLAGAVLPAFGSMIGWLIAWPIRYVQWISKLLAAVPYAAVYTCSLYILLWLILSYVLLGIFLLGKKKHPMLLTVCIVVGLLISLAASYIEPRLDPFRVTVMDVGQGQCILLQTREGNYLVDCGGSDSETAADTAAELLLSQGIFHLDGIILTHFDVDHAGGVPLLLSRVGADKLYLPDISDDGVYKQMLTDAFPDKIEWVREKTQIGKEYKLMLIPGNAEKSENESGLCVLFQEENCDILITGDRSSVAERELVESYDLPKLELLVAGHHGANSSTGVELLSETMPETVVISVGRDNPYGHPAQEMLERLGLFGCRILRTDLNGTIIFRG